MKNIHKMLVRLIASCSIMPFFNDFNVVSQHQIWKPVKKLNGVLRGREISLINVRPDNVYMRLKAIGNANYSQICL